MMQPAETTGTLFTIGHSNLEPEHFLAVLTGHGVKILGDVRSRPGSFRYPQFNREPLEALLSCVGIQYEFLGEALGGRPTDPRVYHENGLVNYAARRKALDFLAGVDRAAELSRTYNMALMCAEEDPLQCHRFLMICPALVERKITPQHIRRGGIIELQSEAEDRLLNLHGFGDVTSTSLFASGRDTAIEAALRRQSGEHAYRLPSEISEHS